MKTFKEMVQESYLSSTAVMKLVAAKKQLDAHDAVPEIQRQPDHAVARQKLAAAYEDAKRYHSHTTR